MGLYTNLTFPKLEKEREGEREREGEGGREGEMCFRIDGCVCHCYRGLRLRLRLRWPLPAPSKLSKVFYADTPNSDAIYIYILLPTKTNTKQKDDPNYDGIWDYQWCSELLPQETYFTLDGKHDMFWDQPMNMTAIDAHCKGKYGFAPRADWIATEFGGTLRTRAYSVTEHGNIYCVFEHADTMILFS